MHVSVHNTHTYMYVHEFINTYINSPKNLNVNEGNMKIADA